MAKLLQFNRPRDPNLRNVEALRQHADQRLVGLRGDRTSWWSHWSELANYILPRRFQWLVSPNQQRGSQINHRIIDSCGTKAARVLGAGLVTGNTNPGRPWFRLTLDDKDMMKKGPVKIWLEECTKRLLAIMAESNFYTAMGTLYFDLGVFGTAPMVIQEDREDVIRCYNAACGEYYLANGDRGDVQTFYREYLYTAQQCATRFGVENASPTVQSAIRTGGSSLGQEVKIAHAIEQNDEYVPEAHGTKGMPYREIYWELGSGQDQALRVRGFHENPVIAPRWDVSGNDAYGRSPGMDALGDIKQIQIQHKRKAQAIDKQVNPPLVAHVSLKNEPASVLPGGVTYAADPSGVGMKPVYEVNPNLADMKEDIRDTRDRIRETFYYDLFMMIAQLDTVRTATEIDARREEKLIQLSPALTRNHGEALDPAIDRIFGIALRKGVLPPVPRELIGVPIRVEYVSMLAELQKAVETAGIERAFYFGGQLEKLRPGTLDKLDSDEALEIYTDRLGVSPRIVVPQDKVLQIRAQRAERDQMAQTAALAAQGAKAAKDLSAADVGGGINAMQMMVGGG